MTTYAPDSSAFDALYNEGKPQVVWTKLVADLETPVSAMLKLAGSQPNSFLLESVEGGDVRGRYSIIGLRPDIVWRCLDDNAEINRQARYDADAFVAEECGAIESLKRLVRESHIDLPEDLPPMASALIGYIGYEMVRLMEDLPTDRDRVIDVPDGLMVRPTIMAIFDNVADEVTIVTPVWPAAGVSARAAYAQACERLADATSDFERNLAHGHDAPFEADMAEATSNTDHERFLEIVQAAKDYINAGDAFQIVLSQRFDLPFTLPPLAYYRALRRVNPSPFLFYLNFGEFAVVGSSPEILVRAREGRVTIRPLAGTRKRGADKAEDIALRDELLADPKERAEHLMLLDLGRNDVGRVAKVGSVSVTESFQIEYYSHVMHISSNVEGDLSDDYDAIDALVAGFPAGTVSGAPKVRAMEVIDELEAERRGVYGGAIGYFSANGSMDTCIALRTAVIKDGVLHIQAGAGVVTDSDPESEHQECRNKARALTKAAEEAFRFADRSGLNR
ncbi:MAG: anthranilate synthase component I [Rhodospirillaceae bacterium]|nr:anthranilate synthase component I [Rhodospirillaceae bacterium]|tara:strand:- start:1394 stop:2911 length:1518 start_codon:yes stop_codon:yes gene_type:complete